MSSLFRGTENRTLSFFPGGNTLEVNFLKANGTEDDFIRIIGGQSYIRKENGLEHLVML